jgi:hypothetical protein
MPLRFLLRDQQRQLERLDEADLANLPRGRLDDEPVLVFKRSLEDGARKTRGGALGSGPSSLIQSAPLARGASPKGCEPGLAADACGKVDGPPGER